MIIRKGTEQKRTVKLGRLEDTVPDEVSLGTNGVNCWVKQQLRPQPAGAYRWGRNRCARL